MTTTPIPERLAALDTIHLDEGCHEAPPDPDQPDAMCVMEAVAWVAGEPWSDSPRCASPVVAAFLRAWNDALDDDDRQQLTRWVPRLVGSAGTPAEEDARAWLALDWLVRTHTPAWLRLAGLDDQAATLERLPELRAGIDVPSIRPAVHRVRGDAAAAWVAAWGAAWVAAWDAGDAIRAAAGDAAWAAWAARAATGDAAWVAAGTAGTAGDAAWVAAGTAGDAAWAALRPTIDTLQQSAHDLIDRMLAITEIGEDPYIP